MEYLCYQRILSSILIIIIEITEAESKRFINIFPQIQGHNLISGVWSIYLFISICPAGKKNIILFLAIRIRPTTTTTSIITDIPTNRE